METVKNADDLGGRQNVREAGPIFDGSNRVTSPDELDDSSEAISERIGTRESF